jgi:hypothetical protein
MEDGFYLRLLLWDSGFAEVFDLKCGRNMARKCADTVHVHIPEKPGSMPFFCKLHSLESSVLPCAVRFWIDLASSGLLMSVFLCLALSLSLTLLYFQ